MTFGCICAVHFVLIHFLLLYPPPAVPFSEAPSAVALHVPLDCDSTSLPSLNISSYRQQRVKLSFFLQPVSLCLFISECSHLRLFLKKIFTNSCRSICHPFSGWFYFYFLPLSKRGYCIGRDGLLLVFLFIYPFVLSNLPTHLHSTWIKINPHSPLFLPNPSPHVPFHFASLVCVTHCASLELLA